MGRTSKRELAHREWLQQLDHLASRGEVNEIFQDLLEHRDEPWDEPHRLKALDKAIKAAAKKGPAALIEKMNTRTLEMTLRIQLLQEMVAHQFLPKWGKGRTSCNTEHLQAHVLPVLDQLYRRQTEITKAVAAVTHTMGLANRSDEEQIREKVIRIVREVETKGPDDTLQRESQVG